jgi:hypothetical protein
MLCQQHARVQRERTSKTHAQPKRRRQPGDRIDESITKSELRGKSRNALAHVRRQIVERQRKWQREILLD